MGRTIYRGMVWGEYLIVYGIRVSLYLRHGENCVCDRYVHDLVVDFLAEEHILSENPLERISRVERLFPVPDLVLLFDVPEEVALSRKTDIRSVESLRLRRELYNRLLDSGDVTPIDGTQVPDKNLHEILEAIAELTPSTDVRQVRT